MKAFRIFPVSASRHEFFKEIPMTIPSSPIFYMKPYFAPYVIKDFINMKEDIYQQIKKMTEVNRSSLAKRITENIHRGLKYDIAVKKVLDKHFPEAYL